MLSGMLPVFKPAGPSSAAIVGRVKRLTKCQRVGHAGTLDPAVDGILVLALNRATRLIPFLPTDKSYRTIIRLGSTTDTLDATGEIQNEQPVPSISSSDIQTVLQQFLGEQQQIPPMISARHHEGKRLYQLARQGKVVEPKPTSIVIHNIKLISWQSPDLELEVDCSRGTYIRSLARDVGEQLGCGAHMLALHRTRCSGFSVQEAIGLEVLEALIAKEQWTKAVVSPERALKHLPEVLVSSEVQPAVQNGCKIPLPKQENISEDTLYRLIDKNNRLLALARPEGEEMKMERVLCPSNEEQE
jgi:tRNA pseudouridine55 synthase